MLTEHRRANSRELYRRASDAKSPEKYRQSFLSPSMRSRIRPSLCILYIRNARMVRVAGCGRAISACPWSRVRGSRSGGPIGSPRPQPITPASSRRGTERSSWPAVRSVGRPARVNIGSLRVPAYASPHRHDIHLATSSLRSILPLRSFPAVWRILSARHVTLAAFTCASRV